MLCFQRQYYIRLGYETLTFLFLQQGIYRLSVIFQIYRPPFVSDSIQQIPNKWNVLLPTSYHVRVNIGYWWSSSTQGVPALLGRSTVDDIQNYSLSKILLTQQQNTCFLGHVYNLKNSLKFKLLAFYWPKMHSELRFVAIVKTSGRVRFVSSV